MCNKVVKKFNIYGDFIKIQKFGSGHINDTYLASFNQAGITVRYVIRKINNYVFKNPEFVVNNTINTIKHITKKIKHNNDNDNSNKVLTILKAKTGKFYHIDEQGDYWCAFLFIENAYTVDFVDRIEQAYEAAKKFGRFINYLIDDDINKYKLTISDFHNPYKRLNLLRRTINDDTCNRVKHSLKEINEVFKCLHIIEKYKDLLKNKLLPIRITHNDTKINNVMFNKKNNKGMVVIDLDTVMPGSVIYDFGDMVRTFSCPASEDEENLSRVFLKIDFFDAIAKGYLGELSSDLTAIEVNNLVYGAELIIYEQAIRFLTDYLRGDQYYNINYAEHNLIRTRNQLSLLKSIQLQKVEMEKIIKKYYNFYKLKK